MKKLIVVAAAIAAMCAIAAPRGPSHHIARPMPHPAPRHAPSRPMHQARPVSPQHHHSSSSWGRGGRNFWPGFVGGLVGSAIVQPAPAIVVPPPPGPYVKQIWVEGHYEMQVINGIYIQVWVPGRWVIVP